MRLRSFAQVSLLVAMATGLSGCAAPIVAGMTLGTLSTIVDTASSILTGKSVEEHVLSWVTGKDCNLTESILRKDRKFCEEEGSIQTADDFRGIFAAFGGNDTDALDRVARARQQELAEGQIAAQPAVVTEASLVSLPSIPAMRIGVPKRGEVPGLTVLNGVVVYMMAPIYEEADLVPQAARKPHRSTNEAVIVPKPKPAPETSGRQIADRQSIY